MKPSILVYFVTWPAVGHAVEGLRHSLGYALANPGSEIHVVLNAQTTVELADLCPWVTAAYAVDTTSRAPFDPEAFGHVPKTWDYVVYDRRVYGDQTQSGKDGAFDRYRAHALHVFSAQIASCGCGSRAIPYRPQAPLRFVLPDEALAFAAERVPEDGTHMALIPAGARNAARYPSLASWTRIVEALHSRFPDITVHLIGKLRREGHPDVTAFSREALDQLVDRFPFPWLAISGGRWPEFFHVGVPFYSVLPDPVRYRAFDTDAFKRVTVDRDGNERIVSMCDERIEADLPEIVDAAEIIVGRQWSFEKCQHFRERRWVEMYENRLVRWATVHAHRPLRTAWRMRQRLRSRRREAEARRHAASLWAAR